MVEQNESSYPTSEHIRTHAASVGTEQLVEFFRKPQMNSWGWKRGGGIFEHPTCEELEVNWGKALTYARSTWSVKDPQPAYARFSASVVGFEQWIAGSDSKEMPVFMKRLHDDSFGVRNFLFLHTGILFAGKPGPFSNTVSCVRPVVLIEQVRLRPLFDEALSQNDRPRVAREHQQR